jgi:hypothetical protein
MPMIGKGMAIPIRSEAGNQELRHVIVGAASRFMRKNLGPFLMRESLRGARVGALIDRQMPSELGYLVGRPEVRQFSSVSAWLDASTAEERERTIADLVVPGDCVADLVHQFSAAGVDKLILPKPVAFNRRDLWAIQHDLDCHHVRHAVASNWHYSQLIARARQEISQARLLHGLTPVRARVRYWKHREPLMGPVYSELPHALQLGKSTGLLDLNRPPVLKAATESGLEALFPSEAVPGGVEVSIQMRFPNDPHRLARRLDVFYPGGARISVDCGMRFDENGKPTSSGGLVVTGKPLAEIQIDLPENSLHTMYETFFEGGFAGTSNGLLSLRDYAPIAEAMFQIDELYRSALKSHHPVSEAGSDPTP